MEDIRTLVEKIVKFATVDTYNISTNTKLSDIIKLDNYDLLIILLNDGKYTIDFVEEDIDVIAILEKLQKLTIDELNKLMKNQINEELTNIIVVGYETCSDSLDIKKFVFK